jgi:hypothetical protein
VLLQSATDDDDDVRLLREFDCGVLSLLVGWQTVSMKRPHREAPADEGDQMPH